jgi:hypothetical protein
MPVYHWRNEVAPIELIGRNRACGGHGNDVSRSLWGKLQQWHARTQAPKRFHGVPSGRRPRSISLFMIVCALSPERRIGRNGPAIRWPMSMSFFWTTDVVGH